jgi:hypothetical protein
MMPILSLVLIRVLFSSAIQRRADAFKSSLDELFEAAEERRNAEQIHAKLRGKRLEAIQRSGALTGAQCLACCGIDDKPENDQPTACFQHCHSPFDIELNNCCIGGVFNFCETFLPCSVRRDLTVRKCCVIDTVELGIDIACLPVIGAFDVCYCPCLCPRLMAKSPCCINGECKPWYACEPDYTETYPQVCSSLNRIIASNSHCLRHSARERTLRDRAQASNNDDSTDNNSLSHPYS